MTSLATVRADFDNGPPRRAREGAPVRREAALPRSAPVVVFVTVGGVSVADDPHDKIKRGNRTGFEKSLITPVVGRSPDRFTRKVRVIRILSH
jgi:hypothetical protein